MKDESRTPLLMMICGDFEISVPAECHSLLEEEEEEEWRTVRGRGRSARKYLTFECHTSVKHPSSIRCVFEAYAGRHEPCMATCS